MGLQKSLSIGCNIQMFVLFTKILVCRGSVRLFIGIFMPFVPFSSVLTNYKWRQLNMVSPFS